MLHIKECDLNRAGLGLVVGSAYSLQGLTVSYSSLRVVDIRLWVHASNAQINHVSVASLRLQSLIVECRGSLLGRLLN